MSEIPSEWETGINKHGTEQVGSAEANLPAPGSRSLQAGGEFLKALASDLAAVASWLRLLLSSKLRRMRPSRLWAASRISQGSFIGRMRWRASIALFGFGLICAAALSAVTLWVLIGFPPEPRKSHADTLRSQFEARKGESPGAGGPLKVTGTSRQDLGREPAQGRPEAKATSPSIAFSGASPPAQGDGTEPKKASKERPIETGAGADQPQLVRTEPEDRRPTARQQQVSTTLTDLRPRALCNVNLCATTYASFHAADCTYQPHGGGPRRICELSTRSADAPQTPPAGTDASTKVMDTQIAERPDEVPKSATPARVGAQCNIGLCAATYASFHAADCTYQPYDGGPRRICER